MLKQQTTSMIGSNLKKNILKQQFSASVALNEKFYYFPGQTLWVVQKLIGATLLPFFPWKSKVALNRKFYCSPGQTLWVVQKLISATLLPFLPWKSKVLQTQILSPWYPPLNFI